MHLQNTITITYRLTGMLINEAIIGTFGCIKHLFHHHRYSYFKFNPAIATVSQLDLCVMHCQSRQ